MSAGLKISNVGMVGCLGGLFTPNSIPNLALWLEGGDLAGLSDGANITSWADPYIGANSATPVGTAPTKQTYRGHPVCRFAGGDRLTTNSFLDSSFDTAFTLVGVYRCTSTGLKVMFSNNATALYLGSGDGSVAKYVYSNLANLSSAFASYYRGDGEVIFQSYNGSTRKTAIAGNASVDTAATGNLGFSGALTLGDLSSTGFAFVGDLLCVAVYKRELTSVERGQLASYLAARYSSFHLFGSITTDGDSLTAGVESYTPMWQNLRTLFTANYPDYGYFYNYSVSGQTLADMETNSAQVDVSLYSPALSENQVVVCWGGTNDLFSANAATVQTRLQTYWTNRRAAGAKVVAVTLIARSTWSSGQRTDAATVNAWIRANPSLYDALADLAARPEFSDYSDLTYYDDDQVHLNNTGSQLAADIIFGVISDTFGGGGWSNIGELGTEDTYPTFTTTDYFAALVTAGKTGTATRLRLWGGNSDSVRHGLKLGLYTSGGTLLSSGTTVVGPFSPFGYQFWEVILTTPQAVTASSQYYIAGMGDNTGIFYAYKAGVGSTDSFTGKVYSSFPYSPLGTPSVSGQSRNLIAGMFIV